MGVDAAVGRNAARQAANWQREGGVSGLVVSKLDGSAKGGFVVSVSQEVGLPVKLVGVGETIEDLRDFDPVLYIDALLGTSPQEVQEMDALAATIAAPQAMVAAKKGKPAKGKKKKAAGKRKR